MKTVFMASGQGTNFKHLYSLAQSGHLPITPIHFITNKQSCGALPFCQEQNLNFTVLSQKECQLTWLEWDQQLASLLEKLNPDLILLLGFLKKIGPKTLQLFPDKILNTHPSLLPKYGGKGMYGLHVHKAVIENKEAKTGITLHRVNGHYDDGDIIDQMTIDVDNITDPHELQKKVKSYEYDFLAQAIKKFIEESS